MSRETIQCAVMFADVAGSTSIYERYGNDVAKATIGGCLDMLTQITHRHNGLVVKTIGDEIMCRYNTGIDAVAAAIAMQEAVNVPFGSQGITLHIRVGLHAGEAILENNDVFGDAVNVAARMAGIAKGQQIITTEDTFKQLNEALQAKCRVFDITAVKGKQEKIKIYDILWDDAADVTRMAFSQESSSGDTMITLMHNGNSQTLSPEQMPIIIGRGAASDIAVDAPLASRSHVKVDYSRGKFILADQSTNGTYVKLSDGKEVFLRREDLPLSSMGKISLGEKVKDESALLIHFVVS
jgi:class 3 adenylate cyclase